MDERDREVNQQFHSNIEVISPKNDKSINIDSNTEAVVHINHKSILDDDNSKNNSSDDNDNSDKLSKSNIQNDQITTSNHHDNQTSKMIKHKVILPSGEIVEKTYILKDD